MPEIFEKPIKIKHLMTTSVSKAKALEDPIRAMILNLLTKESKSIIEIVEELKKKGINKAPTTVRHHVDILKKAGLIELVKLRDVRGGVLKYYASNVRVLGHDLPKDFDEKLTAPIEETSQSIAKIVENVVKKYKDEIKEVASALRPCPYCSPQHFIEYTIVEILHRSIAEAIQKKELLNSFKKIK